MLVDGATSARDSWPKLIDTTTGQRLK